jgi:hypothetical protein
MIGERLADFVEESRSDLGSKVQNVMVWNSKLR